MPYIKQEKRMDAILNPETSGELNYLISSLINQYINTKGLNYTTINEIIGALECCKMEVYRRIAVPYEDIKRKENGDVFYSFLVGDKHE